MTKLFIGILIAGLFSGCTNDIKETPEKPAPPAPEEIPAIDYSVVKAFPHDTTSYTQGLLFHDHKLFESTGSPVNQKQTRSVLGILDTTTGKINVKAELDRDKYFGEGIAILNNKIYQLTWTNQVGFMYDAKTFKPMGQFSFANKEGWGLTTDGTYLVMSDGTNVLSYLDPSTLKVVKTLAVTNGGFAQDYLNELEFINGYLYANVYQRNFIVKIDPSTGAVKGILDLSSLFYKAQQRSPGAEVLNGIAFDAATDKIIVTGKLWRDLYEIDFPH